VAGPFASAADLPRAPVYKAPPPVALFSWTGFYIGANVGYSWGRATQTATVAGVAIPGFDRFDVNGVIGGGQLGYNWQTGNWVWGLETDIQGSGEKNTTTAVGVTETTRLTWFGTTRLRAGFAADRWFLYGTAGAAYGEMTVDFTVPPVTFTSSNTKVGWTAGVGLEHAIWDRWSWKVEYLHLDLGTFNNAFTVVGVPVVVNSRFRDEVLRLGANYRF